VVAAGRLTETALPSCWKGRRLSWGRLVFAALGATGAGATGAGATGAGAGGAGVVVVSVGWVGAGAAPCWAPGSFLTTGLPVAGSSGGSLLMQAVTALRTALGSLLKSPVCR
jgi:hypothetical protein